MRFVGRDFKMTNTFKMFVAIVVLSALVGGCSNKNKKENVVNKISTPTAERSKTKLRNRIERKYTDADAHYELGKLYQADGLWEKAEAEYHIASSFDPAHWRAEAAKVKMLKEKGEVPRSKLSAEQAMNRSSISAESSLLLGKAFQKELLDEYAILCYHQALSLAPNSAGLQKQIGYYYLSKSDLPRAEGYLRRSFQINPYQPEVAGELGRMGVIVKVPRKTVKNTNALDKLLNRE
jgi:tetratricopeptide (TPR) repeat protein